MSRTDHHGNKAKVRLFGDAYRWLENEPKIWRKIMKHQKQRMAVKQSLLAKDHENAVYPLDKKPWHYYW